MSVMAATTSHSAPYLHRSYPLATSNGDASYSPAMLERLRRPDTYSRHLPPLSHTRTSECTSTRCARFFRAKPSMHYKLTLSTYSSVMDAPARTSTSVRARLLTRSPHPRALLHGRHGHRSRRRQHPPCRVQALALPLPSPRPRPGPCPPRRTRPRALRPAPHLRPLYRAAEPSPTARSSSSMVMSLPERIAISILWMPCSAGPFRILSPSPRALPHRRRPSMATTSTPIPTTRARASRRISPAAHLPQRPPSPRSSAAHTETEI